MIKPWQTFFLQENIRADRNMLNEVKAEFDEMTTEARKLLPRRYRVPRDSAISTIHRFGKIAFRYRIRKQRLNAPVDVASR